jgi:hypothetical protein
MMGVHPGERVEDSGHYQEQEKPLKMSRLLFAFQIDTA